MQPTKYKNLYRTTGIFKYIYVEDNFKIEAKDCNDLKFKLTISKIKLVEKTSDEKNKITVKSIHKENKTNKKRIKKETNEPFPNETISENKPLRKNIDYIESEEDVNFGKIHYVDPRTHIAGSRWGPDNSKRARKLRDELIR